MLPEYIRIHDKIKEDVDDGNILDLDAFHVLPAYVIFELHVRHKVLCSG